MRTWIMGVLGAAMLAAAAAAATVGQDEARRLLFPVGEAGLAVVRDNGLDPGQQAIVEAILSQMRAEAAANYYGAVAVSPAFFELMAADPGQAALSGLLQISERFHSVQAAARAALTACERARDRGQAPCVLAAQVLPRNYTARPLQMSVTATAAFGDYRRQRAPKAFAISPASPAYAAASGAAAETTALTRCNQAAQAHGASDCVVVIKD